MVLGMWLFTSLILCHGYGFFCSFVSADWLYHVRSLYGDKHLDLLSSSSTCVMSIVESVFRFDLTWLSGWSIEYGSCVHCTSSGTQRKKAKTKNRKEKKRPTPWRTAARSEPLLDTHKALSRIEPNRLLWLDGGHYRDGLGWAWELCFGIWLVSGIGLS